jgi:hypothetical protein
MVHTCNPSYYGGGDWKDQGSRQLRQDVGMISTHKLDAGRGGLCLNSSYVIGVVGRPWSKESPGKNARL